MTQVPSNPMFYEPPDFDECFECGTDIEDNMYCDTCKERLSVEGLIEIPDGPDPDALFDELREEGRL